MAEILAAGAPLLLLYVEDDQVTREAVCTMVGRRFPELVVHSATNGAEGLQRCLELKPDLVVTDIEMPVMHGIEMSRRILALQRATPIIVTSAHSDMDYFIESIEIGISRYVMKPIDKDKLFAAIEETLVTLRRERELKAQQEFIRKLSRVVEQSPSSIVITDPSGTIEYVNPRFADLTGYTGQEVLGQKLRALQQGGEELWSTLDAGLEWHGELEAVKKSGEPYSESTSISPVFNEHGAITHFVVLQEDITERKQAEEELRLAAPAVRVPVGVLLLLVADAALVEVGEDRVGHLVGPADRLKAARLGDEHASLEHAAYEGRGIHELHLRGVLASPSPQFEQDSNARGVDLLDLAQIQYQDARGIEPLKMVLEVVEGGTANQTSGAAHHGKVIQLFDLPTQLHTLPPSIPFLRISVGKSSQKPCQ